ncbi:MAG: methyltransferase [Candidatus Saganbacteria bacterium]|nr:methyltransferase [Candidatus Saganbacteria bacterium]
MQPTVSFFVKGKSPLLSLKRTIIDNGILKNDFGIQHSIVAQRQLDQSTHLFQLSLNELQQLQFQQGIPFQGFRGETAKAFEPKDVLVISKGTKEPAHLATMDIIGRTLKLLGIRFEIVNVSDLRTRHFLNRDMYLGAGGDGTILRSAHLISNSTPLLGIVSDKQVADSNPLGSWGNYLPLEAENLEAAINLMSRGEFEIALLNRIGAILRREGEVIRTTLALNELFINEQDSAQAVKYKLKTHGIVEPMSDSGLLIATGSGSSANGWISNSMGLTFDPTSRLIQFKLREPTRFFTDGSQRVLTHGFAQAVELESTMYHNPRASIDGAGKHYAFPKGSELTVKIMGSPISFPVFPSIANIGMTRPDGPIAEVGLREERLGLTAAQIQEIDALPICASVKKGEKRQILFLQVTKDMKKLHLARILKTGGQALRTEDLTLKGTIDNPTLLYPTAEIASMPAVARDVIFGLYTYGLRITEFAGVISEWDSSIDQNVWGPSVDTTAFMYALLENNILNDRVISAAEVGTGSGTIAKAAIINCQNLRSFTDTDIVKRALECARRNLDPVIGEVNLNEIHEKGIKSIGQVDLLMVNPPYLPEAKVSGEVDQYRGLGLIHEVLKDGKEHLNPDGSVVINFSSCAEKEFKQWVEDYGWKIKELYKIAVPLKIVRVYEDPEWLDFMLEHGGLEIRNEQQTGYRYWHTLNIVQLTPKKD